MTSNEANSSNPVFAASSWVEGALTGAIAGTIAILAVVSVGLLMLGGRIDVRQSAQVVLGCFIIFGASSIAAGIHSAISRVGSGAPVADIDPPPYYPPAAPAPPQSVPAASDPYAGAAVPRR